MLCSQSIYSHWKCSKCKCQYTVYSVLQLWCHSKLSSRCRLKTHWQLNRWIAFLSKTWTENNQSVQTYLEVSVYRWNIPVWSNVANIEWHFPALCACGGWKVSVSFVRLCVSIEHVIMPCDTLTTTTYVEAFRRLAAYSSKYINDHNPYLIEDRL